MKVFFIIEFVLVACFFYFGGLFFLNVQLAFLGASLIFFINFKLYEKKLKSDLANEALIERLRTYNEDEEDKEKIKEAEKVRRTLKFSAALKIFSPWKILAYLFLVLAFLFLNRKALFNVFAFIFGIFLAQLGAILTARRMNAK